MTPRPTIFISAVSKELKSSRQLVANTLQFLGYQPVWQDVFGTEQGDLRDVLRRQIDGCQGVVQLVGHCYGAEPPAPDETFGRVSYTQYEALHARRCRKKVWYLFLDEQFPSDAATPEPEELRELQAAYRRRLQSESSLFHPLNSREALETNVLKLRDELARLRRGVRQWAFGMAGLLLGLTALIIWILHGQQKQTKIIQKQGAQVSTLVDHYQKMGQALAKLAEVESHQRYPGEKLTSEEQRARAYSVLEKELGLPTGALAKELPAFAMELYNRADTTLVMRARAAYALNRFEESEKLSLEAANQDRRAYENAKQVADDRRKKAIEEFELAGQSADKRIQYADALKYYREAAQLTDLGRDPVEWAGQQWNIARVLQSQGNYAEAEKIYRSALREFQRVRGGEDKSVLAIRNNLATARQKQGSFAEAEMEYRAIAKLREKVLGPEHPDTLGTRNDLAVALEDQGKYVEAAAEYRQVLALREKVLGPEHPDTLGSQNNLANSLFDQARYAEAEKEHRLVLKLRANVLGAEHPQTLDSRCNLANVLVAQAKYAEAEAEFRAVIALRQKLLGPEHPQTLDSRNNLGVVLVNQGKYAEAEVENRAVIKLKEKVLGPEHPDTLGSRNNLVDALDYQGKYEEAEAESRAVITLKEKVLGMEHPDTLISRVGLAVALLHREKYAEAEVESRAALKLDEKVFGPEHAVTLASRDNLANALFHQGKHSEAEAESRAVLKLKEKVYGPEHPDTFRSCYDLALCLKARNELAEASTLATRAAEGTKKTLSESHPDAVKYEKLRQELNQRN